MQVASGNGYADGSPSAARSGSHPKTATLAGYSSGVTHGSSTGKQPHQKAPNAPNTESQDRYPRRQLLSDTARGWLRHYPCRSHPPHIQLVVSSSGCPRHLARHSQNQSLHPSGPASLPVSPPPLPLHPLQPSAIFNYLEGFARAPHCHGAPLRSDEFSTSLQLRPSVTVYINTNTQHGI